MRQTVLRAVVTLVASASIALAGAAGVHAADPTADTIGVGIYPGIVRVDERQAFTIQNRGSVPMDFDIEAPGGWTVEPTHVSALGVHDFAEIRIVRSGDDGSVYVRGSATGVAAASGQDLSIAAVEVPVVSGTPWPVVRAALFVLLVVATVVVLLLRTRPWELRVSRSGR
jgi:hypothetical protein